MKSTVTVDDSNPFEGGTTKIVNNHLDRALADTILQVLALAEEGGTDNDIKLSAEFDEDSMEWTITLKYPM